MKPRHLLAALLATLLLFAAAPAYAETTIVVRPISGGAARLPDDGGGGGYAGCWRAYIVASDSHWTTSSWSHHFNPAWCGMGGKVITQLDAGWHYQTTTGFYGPLGVSHWVISGCVRCRFVRLHAQARFSFSFWGWTSHFNDDRYITLYPNGTIGP